jgi:transcriptional regulator with XRE-family HTH domain
MDASMLVAWKLRRLRVAQDLAQEGLAADANIDRAYVGRLESGLENPTVGILDRLAAALSVKVGDLLIEPKRGEPRPTPLRGGHKASKAAK